MHSLARFIAAAVTTLTIGSAFAVDYALIMGIGNYQRASANLQGIDKDVAAARRIAQNLGVRPENIRELNDSQVTHAGVAAALREMENRLQPGDRAFIYYSGHGGQESLGSTDKCTEGMYVYDMRMYADADLEQALARIAGKAGQLIMFNDSCFSGGAATRASKSASAQPKFFKAVEDRPGYECGNAVNMKSAANRLLSSASSKGNNFVYIAAADDDEVAWATPNGSAATVAWERCLRSSSTDTNGSGALNADELMACAQREVTRMSHKQTITVLGNRQMPLSFAASSPLPASTPEAVARSRSTLEDIRQTASPASRVELQTQSQVRINADVLNFSVRSSRSGYLYLLHVGSDGRAFNLLFPNDLDTNNYIQGGSTVQLPRASWRVRAGGPAGESHVLAIVSDTQKTFPGLGTKQGPFKSSNFSVDIQKNLFIEATGAGSTSGSPVFGASQVMSIREIN